MEVLDWIYWGNSLRAYLIAAAAALSFVLGVRLFVYVILRRLAALAARTETSFDDIVVKVLGATSMTLALVVALYAGSLFLTVAPHPAHTLRTAAVIALVLQLGIWSSAALTAGATRLYEKKAAAGDTTSVGVFAMIRLFGRVLVWALMALLVLENLGVDITALVAGLGIGGIAVALAAQNVLADLFASVSILLDKPFEVGDTIHVGDMIGTVQNIGIKTTRLRSVTGEQLVMSNSDLLKERIRNYKRMTERRALFTVSVTYDTPVATLEKIPQLVRAIVDAQPDTRFDRAHLHSFGDSSLDFEVAYFITRAEYMVFMDVQQTINLSLLRQLQELGVSFAFPTRTVHLLREGA